MGSCRSGTLTPLAHALDELLAAVGQHLATIPAGGHGNEADNGQSEGQADQHAEDECKHASRVGPHAPTGKPTHAYAIEL